MYLEMMVCDKCNFVETIKSYFLIQIKPQIGCFESEIERLFCVDCNSFTYWFMGKVPKQHLQNEKKCNNKGIIKFRNEYFKNINSKPRCLECGTFQYLNKPKHYCGGNLSRKLDVSIHMDIDFKILKVYEYDDFGKVLIKCIS